MLKQLFVRPLVVVLLIAATLATATPLAASNSAQYSADRPWSPGMVIVESNQSFETTWNTLVGALEANPNIRLVTTIDHAAAAESVGLELAPNRVAVFGNPNLGTPIMQINQLAGLDLPQKIQVFEQDDRVWIGYNDPTYLAQRHFVGDAPTLDVIAGALRTLTGVAAADENVDEVATGSEILREYPGLIIFPSDASMDTTWNRLIAAIEASPANIAFQIDHQANAASAGLELGPTRVVAFGNPNLGTPLMVEQPTAGFDLPLKFLVWEQADGQVVVATNDLGLARRHSVFETDLSAVNGATRNFLDIAIHS